MQPGRAPSAPCFVANVRNVCRINKKVLISNRQQKINSQNLNVIIFLFSAIDRTEIVFHHLCFLLMYSTVCAVLPTVLLHSYLIVTYWNMRLGINSLVRAYKHFIQKMFQSHPIGRDNNIDMWISPYSGGYWLFILKKIMSMAPGYAPPPPVGGRHW